MEGLYLLRTDRERRKTFRPRTEFSSLLRASCFTRVPIATRPVQGQGKGRSEVAREIPVPPIIALGASVVPHRLV
jgi:hypothetical protein